ncbi:hypothetical protein [Mesorhizobium amorphae]|uniref:hypothetical protein n=1 Tax=Mesorhizobium amorphae TaxID=71433 RepID=UPI001FEF2939|nr:hypothetical protein [Mesorhizobium amorphae]
MPLGAAIVYDRGMDGSLGVFARAAFMAVAIAMGGSTAAGELEATASKRIPICHGYSCNYRTILALGPADGARFRAILRAGAGSAQAERSAISKAVRYFEQRILRATGVRDLPQSQFGASRIRGQMDCVDESTNTHALLVYLAERKLLRFHKVEDKASRGLFVDGRYPHWTAVISDRGGTEWVVDTWYAAMGGAPDIFPLSRWKERGVLESGALD